MYFKKYLQKEKMQPIEITANKTIELFVFHAINIQYT